MAWASAEGTDQSGGQGRLANEKRVQAAPPRSEVAPLVFGAAVFSRLFLLTGNSTSMHLFATFPDDLPADTDLRTFLAHTALIIPSSQHEAATALLRQQFYRPPQQKSPPLLKRVAYHILRRGPRFPPDKKIPTSSLRRILILRYDGLETTYSPHRSCTGSSKLCPMQKLMCSHPNERIFLAALDPHVSQHVPIYDRPQFHYSFSML